ncbi:malonyl-CoA decarboxylase mitochondrial-like, partial [Trifolium pratense]
MAFLSLMSVSSDEYYYVLQRYCHGEKRNGSVVQPVCFYILQMDSFSRNFVSIKTPFDALMCQIPSAREEERKSFGLCSKFSLTKWSGMSCKLNMVERINWMADLSEKGLSQSGGIMVNYVYSLDNIEEYAHSYFSNGIIQASSDIRRYVE